MLLITYISVLPFALMLALVGRYGTGVDIIPEAAPMIIIFSIAFIATTTFLANRPITLKESYLFLGIMSIGSAYLACLVIISIFRWYYSLGFIGIFSGTTATWIILLERYRTRRLFAQIYAVPPFGNYNSVMNLGLKCKILTSPDQLTRESFNWIVFNFDTNVPDVWVRGIASAAIRGTPILSLNDVIEFATGRTIAETFSENDFFSKVVEKQFRILKRILDIVFSFFALIIIIVPGLAIAIAIKLTSPGPVFFSQKRVGLEGELFTLFKFRTMRHEDRQESNITLKDDTRITPPGRLLRHARIDEWPQFFNVLIGQMSIVGPRPEQPSLADEFERCIPHYQLRYLARPGITGWAQINHGYADDMISTRRKLEFDLYYIKHMNFFLDIKIFLKTISVLVSGTGHR
jgi:UDP-GalNAc:undecaprenyl-phosphate GalNAc-1-phosphate transferase